jgi:hypothetical protein
MDQQTLLVADIYMRFPLSVTSVASASMQQHSPLENSQNLCMFVTLVFYVALL